MFQGARAGILEGRELCSYSSCWEPWPTSRTHKSRELYMGFLFLTLFQLMRHHYGKLMADTSLTFCSPLATTISVDINNRFKVSIFLTFLTTSILMKMTTVFRIQTRRSVSAGLAWETRLFHTCAFQSSIIIVLISFKKIRILFLLFVEWPYFKCMVLIAVCSFYIILIQWLLLVVRVSHSTTLQYKLPIAGFYGVFNLVMHF